MIVKLHEPSVMDAETVKASDAVMAARPRRYSKSQRRVNMIPFSVTGSDGVLMDQGYLTVDVKTGKVTVEHRLNEVSVEDTEELE